MINPVNFIELYKELIDKAPHLAVHNFRCENSDYSDQLSYCRNAYLCFNGDGIEDCYHTYDSRWNKNCVDLSYSNKSELCYECIDIDECYNSNFLQDCERCTDSQYCYDCVSCQNCFGCVGLHRAKFHIFNILYSSNVYAEKVIEAQKMSQEDIRIEMENLRKKHPHAAMRIRQSENCLGDYIFDSKNSYYVSKMHNAEDCYYATNSQKLKDCVDVDMTHRCELTYESIEDNQNYNCNFLYWCADLRDCEYMMYSFNCNYCFGCFNLKHKKFHILNQPYDEKTYFQLITEIKKALLQEKNYRNFLPDIIDIYGKNL